MDTATWIVIALLVPAWWGLALLLLALLGDVSPGRRARMSRLFDRLEGRGQPMEGAVR